MPGVTRRHHLKAVNAAVTEAGDRLTAIDSPLIQLCRSLASKMDAAEAGEGQMSAVLVGEYSTALNHLRRVLREAQPARPVQGGNPVDELRSRRQRRG